MIIIIDIDLSAGLQHT